MKKYILEFARRGFNAMGFGPLVWAVVYLVLQKYAVVDTLTINQMCTGIFSLTALAFIAGGMNMVYQIERLPLMVAILIHGCVLYVCYLMTYLVNDWLENGVVPVFIFTAIFVVGFVVIWVIICLIMKRKTARVNDALKEKQRNMIG